MGKTSEAFIDYELMKFLKKAKGAGIIKHEVPDGDEYEEPHLSQLERVTQAFDEAEVFVTTYTLVHDHWDSFVRILKYIQKEGENTHE